MTLSLLSSLAIGPMVPQRTSQARGGTENTHQVGACCRKNLQVVCMWPKQETSELFQLPFTQFYTALNKPDLRS